MSVEVLQLDIYGEKNNVAPDGTSLPKGKASSALAKKPYRELSIADGIDEKTAAAEAMLIHRGVQRKLLYFASDSRKKIFLKVLKNEMQIKSGEIDSLTAVRDSLLEFFAKK